MLVACTQPVAMIDETLPAPLPQARYAAAEDAGAAVYRVLPQESLILVRVGRDGRMKHLGHDHAVASEDVQGLVAINEELPTSHAHLVFPVRNLIVDRADYRAQLGLDTNPDEDDIAGTYTNMLKVLEPQLHPWVEMQVLTVSGSLDNPTLSVSVTLHGAAFEYLLPVEMEIAGDRLVVTGQASIRHVDFDLSPYSAAGGLLKVADELQVDMRVVAVRQDR